MGDLVVASIFWSFSFGLIKTHLAGIDPTLVAWIRLSLSFLVFLPLLRFRNLAMSLQLMGLGGIQLGLMYVLYIASYTYLLAHQVALLTVSTPLLVVFFDAAIERRWRNVYVLSGILAVFGTAILVVRGSDWHLALKGIALITAANACFAGGQLGYRRFKPKHNMSHAEALSWMYLGAVLVPAALLGFSADEAMSVPDSWHQWLTLVYLGIVPSGFGFFLWNRGATKVNSGLLAVMNNLKIPLAALVAWLVFGEHISWLRFSACALLLGAAVALVNRNRG